MTGHLSGRFIALATFFLVFFVASGASAQDQSTATLKITASSVGDATGRRLVEVRSVDDRRVVRSATAGPVTPVEIRALPPGTYRVIISREGNSPAEGEVTVDPGEIVWIVATLRAPAQGANASDFRIADRTHAGEAVVIREPQLRGMPSSANVWSLVDALVPWTLIDGIDGGGSETGRRGLFGARDGSFTWNSFVMDGVDLTDPDRPGTPLQYPDVKALQAVTVTSGLAPAELQAPGAQVTLVPRRPGRTRHGSLEFAGTNEAMVAKREVIVAPYITRLQSWGDVNAQLDLPLRPGLGAFLAGRVTRSSFADRGRPVARRANVGSMFGHLVARPTANNEVRIIASAERTTRPLEGGDAFLGRATDETDTFSHAQLRWEHVAAGGTTGTVAFGVQRGTFAPDLDLPVTGGVVDRVYDGPMRSPVADRTSRRVDLGVGLHLPSRQYRRSSHAFRFDASVTRARATSEILASPNVAELVGGIPARVWEFVAPAAAADRRLTHVGWSVADDMRIGDHLVLDAGVRLDHWRGRADGAPAPINEFTVSERLSARSNFPGHNAAMYGAIGRYHPRLPLEWLAFGDPSEPWARLYRWTDPNSDGRFDPSERGPQLALAGFGAHLGSVDPKLRMPRTTEYVLGGEYRIRTALFRATATIRHERSLVRALNVGIPLSSYTQTMIPDQTDDGLLIPVYNRPPNTADADRYMLTNAPDDHLIYHALEIVYEQPITPNFRMRISALEWWTGGPTPAPGFHVRENDQGLVGELFQDPNTLSNAKGSNFFDRSYVLKWFGSYLAPKDVWLSFTANYRDGQAFAGLIPVTDLTQGPEPIQSYRRGRTRFTFTMLLDARVEKRFRLAGQQAALWLDVYNFANMYEEFEEDPVPGPVFRRSTSLQPPLTFRAGFRVGF